MSDPPDQDRKSWNSSFPGSLYQVLFEEAAEGLFIVDPRGRCIAVNPTGAALTGYRPEEILGLAVSELIPPGDPAEGPLWIDGGPQERIVLKDRRLRRKDGHLLPLEISVRKLPDGNLMWIVPDRVDRRDVEESQVRLIAILENTSDLVSTATPDARLTFLNRAGRKLVGWGEGEALDGRVIGDLHPVWALRKIESEGLPAAAATGLWEGEVAILHRDGREIPVSQVILAHRSPDGVLQYFSTIMRDITERRRIESDLRHSEERFRLTFLTSPDSININRLEDGLYVDINDGFTRLTGFTREDVIGKTSLAINIWHDPKDREELVRGLKQQGFYNDLEAKFQRKDGSVGIGQMSARVIQMGGAPHIISVTRDITGRRQSEEDREKLQAQLLQAQKMESVGRLAGGVAHDFNNMLAAILGHTELALEEVSPGQSLRSNLEEIRKAAQRSADLTRQLLAFARRQTVAPRVLDLNDTVDGMLKMLRRLIGEDIDLVWIPQAGLWPVKVDPSQVDQVLANLCVNARDAIVGVGKLTIETANASFNETYCRDHPGFVPGEYVLLAVSDDGQGMEKDILNHLFEPFFTTKELGLGTGLGLATVYGIAKQNKGFINVYSEPGKGTTLKIYFPRAAGEADVPLAAPAEEQPRSGEETVLLVEDEQAILDLGLAMLQRLGYTVLTGGTPEEAIRKAEAHREHIHLLITDVVLPGLNGRDLAARITALKPGLKCLFMSGYTANVIAHHGVLEKGVCFLQKPFSLQDLASKVREALDVNDQGDREDIL